MEEMTYYDYLPGGRGHKRWEQFLCEFRRALAETIGTFVLILTVCLGSASPHTSQPLACAAEGLVLMGLVFSIGQVSGSHYNPATSLAFALRFAFEWWRLLYYLPAQFIGAMLASLVVMGFLGTEGDVGATLPQGMSINAALGMEVLFSAILIFVTLNVAERAKVVGASAAIAVGVLLIALTVIGAPLSGASMNPFRSLAPALLAGGRALDQVWIYIVGPLIGAVIAVLLTCLLGSRVHPYAYNKATGSGRSGPEDLALGKVDEFVDDRSEEYQR